MTLAFAGTAPFGADILRGLLDPPANSSACEVAIVVSQPDRPAGRGKQLRSPAVAQLARERGLELVQPERMHDEAVLARLRELGVETIVVAAFGQMIREPLLSEFLMLNVHGSLLPEYRGAAPVERSIMDGRTETGVCIMRMDAGLDTGPVALERRVPIGPDDDAGVVFAAIADAGVEALHAALTAAARGDLTFTAQPAEGATYAHKITADDRVLSLDLPARRLHDRIRALSPHIGAHVSFGATRVTLWRTRVLDAANTAGDDIAVPVLGRAGAVAHDMRRLVLGCGDGALEVVELQPTGKRRMQAGDWLRGLREPLGDVQVHA